MSRYIDTPQDYDTYALLKDRAQTADRRSQRGSTSRTHRLAWDATRRSGRFVEEAELNESYVPPDKDMSPIFAAAYRFKSVYPSLTPVVRDGERIVGAKIQAEEEPDWGWVPDGSEHYVDRFAGSAPPDRPDIRDMAARGLLSPASSFNHKVVDFEGFIRTGSAAISRRARDIAEERTGSERDVAVAIAMGHEAIMAHAATYVTLCTELASSAAPGEAEELAEIARVCERVPAYPARTFREAVQSFWFAYMVAGDGVGRPDLFLNDFYEADIAAGRTTPEEALELIECLLIKLHGDYASSKFNVSSIHTMTLGGQLSDGSDASNDLTRLFLKGMRNVRLLRPTVYVRCHDQTPEDVLTLAVTLLGEGLAQPSFYGDKPIVEGLVRNGISREVARDYALSGCTEVVSPGRGNWGAPSGWVNLACIADDALRECATRENPTTEVMWQTIRRHMEELAEVCRVTQCWLDERDKDTRYNATLFMPSCLERCQDVVHGGAESYLSQWAGIGLPNAANMVHAAMRLALEANEPLDELFERIDADDSELRSRLKSLPAFGNDCAKVDQIGARLVSLMAEALERCATPLRTSLTLGHLAGGENMHIAYGFRMGATLDGRSAGQTLADSLTGSQGTAISGPTAQIRSTCRLDHSLLIGGNVSTLQLSPAEFSTPDARAKVVALIQAFVAMGGSQLQFNVSDAQTLREAQKDPETYRGLFIRVAGYSADFTGIGKTLQDEIIARTEGVV
jgi:pyruvate-formate lyase